MISVIIPVYRAEPFLAECLDSVCNQNFHDLDIILIDDGSPDRSGEICEKYASRDSRIRVFHTKNQGHYLAREFALGKAREIGSKYIGFVDADDWIEPDMYETLVKSAEETGADVTLCGYYVENVGSRHLEIPPAAVYDRIGTLSAFFSTGLLDKFWNKIYRIECFDHIRFPDKRSYCDALVNHDIYMGIRSTVCLPVAKYHYRQVSQSIIHMMDINLINRWLLNKEKYEHCSTEMRGKVGALVFNTMMKQQTRCCANAIAANWRWWNHHTEQEKQDNQQHLADMNAFSKAHLPLFGYADWPVYLKVYSFLSHYNNPFSLWLCSLANRLFIVGRKLKGKRLY